MDEGEKKKYLELIRQGDDLMRFFSNSRNVNKQLEYYKDALRIHFSERLERRIFQLQAYVSALSSDDDSDGETEDMVEIGNGFCVWQPVSERLKAFDHKGILFLWSLWNLRKGGILSDESGLQKILQVCSFLGGMIHKKRIKCILIVTPRGYIENWIEELNKCIPGINICVFSNKTEREQHLTQVQREGGICMTTYALVTRFADVMATYKRRSFTWDYVFLDEGHKIKNPTTKGSRAVHQIRSENRIVLSVTPIMNNLMELWSLLDWAHEGQLLGCPKTFWQNFDMPISRAQQSDSTDQEKCLGRTMSRELQSIIQPYLLCQTKSEWLYEEGQSTDTAPHVPTLTNKEEIVCWIFLSQIQIQIYKAFLLSDDVAELLSSTASPLTALTVLKNLCNHPRLMSNHQCRKLGLSMDDESVDLDKLDTLAETDTSHFTIDHVEDERLIAESGKMKFAINLLDKLKADGHRCILFSQSRKILNIVEKIARNREHRFVRIDGNVRGLKERQKIIKTFETDLSYTLFLATTRVEYLAVTTADRVILFDPSWNPVTDSQAVDRVFQMSRSKDTCVYRLVTCGTVEEKIFRRQVVKEELSKVQTGDQQPSYCFFSSQDLQQLFHLDDTSVSFTQQKLSSIFLGKRRANVTLDTHIEFLHTLGIFGVSDHSQICESKAHGEREEEADVEDADIVFAKDWVSKALNDMKTESDKNREIAENLGVYPGPLTEGLVKLFKTSGHSRLPKWNFKRQQAASADLDHESESCASDTSSPERAEFSDKNLQTSLSFCSHAQGIEEPSRPGPIPAMFLSDVSDESPERHIERHRREKEISDKESESQEDLSEVYNAEVDAAMTAAIDSLEKFDYQSALKHYENADRISGGKHKTIKAEIDLLKVLISDD